MPRSIIALAAGVFIGIAVCSSSSHAQSKALQQDTLNLIQSTPLFRDLGIAELTVEDNGYSARLAGDKVFFFKGRGAVGDVWNLAIHRAGFDLDSAAGSVAAAALKGFQLSDALFIASPDENTVDPGAMPTVLQGKIAQLSGESGDIALKKGVDVYAALDLGASSAPVLKFVERTLGVSGAVKVAGVLESGALMKLAGKGGAGSTDFSISVSATSVAPASLAYVGSARDLSLTFSKTGGDGGLSGGLTFDFSLGGQSFTVPLQVEAFQPNAKAGETYLKISGGFASIPGFLNKIPGLSTRSLLGTVTATATAAGGHELALGLEATGTLHSQPVDFTLNLVRDASGKVEDFEAAFVNTKLPLGDLPGLRDIPGAKTFTLENPVASRGALGGKLNFRGESVDAVVFDDPAGGWHLGLKSEESLTVGELIGSSKGLPAKILLPKAQFILSTKAVNAPFESMPLAMRQFFAKDGAEPAGDLKLAAGINVQAQFDPTRLDESVRKPLAFIGITDSLEIGGTAQGLFGGPPAVSLSVALSASGNHGFKFLKKSASATESFFIRIAKEDLEIGFDSSVELPGGKDQGPLTFDVSFEIEELGESIVAAVRGSMRGDWRNAAGIKGFTLENPFLSVGVNETGAFDVSFDGTAVVGSENIRVAADIVVLPEAAFVPEALALAGTINRISFDELSRHGNQFSSARHGKGLSNGGFKGAQAEFRDVAFAFMTAGAHLPPDLEQSLKIEGAGLAIRGALLVNGKELGRIAGYASDEGLKFDGKLDPFALGPLSLKDAELDVAASLSKPPSFLMSGDLSLFRGFEDQYRIAFLPTRFEFYSDTKFGGLMELSIDAKTTHGLSFSPQNDFEFDATLSADYHKAFVEVMQAAVQTFKKGDSDIRNAEAKVNDAKRRVDGLKRQIADSQAADRRNYENARSNIGAAQRKVDGLKRNIDDTNSQISHWKSVSRHSKWPPSRWPEGAKADAKITELGTELTGLYAAYGTAKTALDAANAAARGAIEGISPKTRSLQAELATAQAALDAANGVLEAARGVDDGLAAASKALESAGDVFRIEALEVSGSLRGITSGGREGDAPVLKARVKIAGANHVYVVSVAEGEKEFKNLVKHVADQAAQDLVKALTRR